MADRVEISKRLILINSLAGLGVNVVNFGVVVWLYRYLLQRISPEEFALYPVVASITVFLPLLTVVLSSGLGRYTVEAYAQGNQRRVTQIVSTMFPLHLAAGLLVTAVGGLLAWHIDSILTIPPSRLGDARIMVFLLVLSFAVSATLAPFQPGFQIRQRIALLSTTVLGRELTRLAILFVLVLGVSPRVLWVVVSSTAAIIAWAVVTTVLSRRLVPALVFRPSEISWPLAGRLTSFGGWMLAGQLAWMLRQSMDPLILNKLATPFDVTCFHLGSLPVQRLSLSLGVVYQAVIPQTTALYALRNADRLRSVYLRLSRYLMWASLIVGLPLAIYSREVVRLWVGEAFWPAATVMALLLSILAVTYGQGAMDNIAEAKAQVRSVNLRGLGLEIINLAATLCLVGSLRLGAIGSALATFLTVTLGYPLINWPLGLRLADLRCRRWLRETFLPGLVPGLVSVPVWLGLKFWLRPAAIGTLGFCMAVGAAVYVAVLLMGCLQPVDRADLKRGLVRVGRFGKGSRPFLVR